MGADTDTLPATLHIGPMDYAVQAVPDLYDGHQKVDGTVAYHDNLISVEANMAAPLQRQTIWHEVLHACLCQAGFADHDERMVEVLAYGVMDVLRRNPWLRGGD